MIKNAKLLWYYNRLRAMSAGEIAHRAAEALKKRADRRRKNLRARDYGALPALPSLKDNLTAWDVPRVLLGEWRDEAAKAQKGQFFLLGQAWPAGDADRKWHLDPVTGSFWPSDRYCFSINYRHTDQKGDVKYVWELGRLQYLQPIAALAFKTQDQTLARFCLQEIESWIDNNPPYKGVHWSSGIELGLRVVSILFITTLTSDYITDAQRTKIWSTLREHGIWLARYPSRFSSANNHLTAEALGLFLIGTLCPTFREAKRWKRAGWALLQDTAEKQILPDGTGAEQTPNYTAVVLEMLLLGLHVAQRSGSEIPESYTHKIILGGEYLRWFTDAGGNVPRIGDDDNARVIGSYRVDETYVNSVLASIAAMFRRSDLTPPAYSPHLRNALFGEPLSPSISMEGLHTFEQGGYTVGRHLVNGHEIWLAVDHGYLGYLSIAAHGHADALALWLHLDGKPVLVDSGTYLYHSGGKWRDYFRGTQAHNTLRMEHADSSTMSGHFNWSHKAEAARTSLETGAGHWQIDAMHDGYVKRFGALHRRRVALTPLRGITVEDSITGDAPRKVDINFLLHPSLTARAEKGELHILRDTTLILKVRHLSKLALSVHAPGTPECGWYSSTFGQKIETTRFTYSGILAPSAKAVTDFTFVWPA